jgi:hypothetical protein
MKRNHFFPLYLVAGLSLLAFIAGCATPSPKSIPRLLDRPRECQEFLEHLDFLLFDRILHTHLYRTCRSCSPNTCILSCSCGSMKDPVVLCKCSKLHLRGGKHLLYKQCNRWSIPPHVLLLERRSVPHGFHSPP